MPSETIAIDLAKRYWDVANAIVAFSVLQMLSLLYALANKEFRGHVARAYPYVIAAIAVSFVLYSAGVVGCYAAERRLLKEEVVPYVHTLLPWTMLARVGIIGLYSGFGIAVLVVGKCSGWE